ncbi:unnamed protein product, partial [Laminaria digitata]
KNYKGVYRYVTLAVWLVTSAIMILDRFYWNVWPRQSICTDGCGNDSFCPMDEDPGCLKDGPWSVKVFDVIARISARLVISTTTLMFLTMSHGTWNYLSEVEKLRPYLYGWRGDNFWLHTVGGWSIGIWVIAHVWSLLLPSLFHGYANVKIPGEFGWLPPQVPIPGGNLDAELEQARWGVDDIWRIFWMTVIFGMLMPLSRSMWMMGRNFSLAMILHTALGCGFFFDSVRRKTHPHVWILNTPFVIWYIIDKVWMATKGRVDPLVEATRVQLDNDYMLLLWRHDDKPKRICDLFWVRKSRYDMKGSGGELAHPFTTCSSHDVDVTGTPRISPSRGI